MSKHATLAYGEKMLEVVKVVNNLDQSFSLMKVYVHKDRIVSVHASDQMNKNFVSRREAFPEGLDKRTEFSSLSFNGGAVTNYITVVGSPEVIASKV